MEYSNSLTIMQKTYDMALYGHNCVVNFPKSEKFALGAEIKQSLLTCISLIIRANKKFHKKTTLQDLDIELEKLRYLVRIAKDIKILPLKQYELWSERLAEIGRMVGGWLKASA